MQTQPWTNSSMRSEPSARWSKAWITFSSRLLSSPKAGDSNPRLSPAYPEIAALLPKADNPHGQVGIVNDSKIFDMMLRIFDNVYFSRFAFFTSFEEAVADFEQKLANLPDD